MVREMQMRGPQSPADLTTANAILDKLAKHRHRRPLTDPDAA